MNTNQILSFEEFSTRGTDTATAEAPTTDTATVDTDTTATDIETTTDNDAEETTDSEETTDTEETEEEATEESEEVDAEAEVEAPTVAEMYKNIKEACKNEAMKYEADDYAEHTKDTYMTEMATLAAETACGAIEEMYEKENCTKEQYEAACNSIKEAYAKKCNEACEAYGTSENERPESENEPVQGPENSIITKTEA